MNKDSFSFSGILPATAGLLISIAARIDSLFVNGPHSARLEADRQVQYKHISDWQILRLREARMLYQNCSKLIETGIERMRTKNEEFAIEEMLGKGYYKPINELIFRSWAKDEALLEAVRLATEKPELDGPKPTLTFTEIQVGEEVFNGEVTLTIPTHGGKEITFPNHPRIPTFDLEFDKNFDFYREKK